MYQQDEEFEYSDEILESENTSDKEPVEAGIITNLLKSGAKFLDRFFNTMQNTWANTAGNAVAKVAETKSEVPITDKSWTVFEVLTGGDYPDEEKVEGNFPFRFGIQIAAIAPDYMILNFALKRRDDDDSKAVVDRGVKVNLADYTDVMDSNVDFDNATEEELEKFYGDFFEKGGIDKVYSDELMKLFDKLGIDEAVEDMAPISASSKISLTLKKITASESTDVHLVSINSAFSVDETNEAIDALLDTPEFIDSLPENEPASFDLYPSEDDYDVEECDGVEICMEDTIRILLKPIYNLFFDSMYLTWNTTGANYPYVVSIVESYGFIARNLIDQLSAQYYAIAGYAPHPSEFACDCGSCCDEYVDTIACMQSDIADIIHAIDLHYCNFEGQLQGELINARDTLDRELNYTLARFQ